MHKLVIVDGPSRGKEFPLADGETVLGRTNETPIELPSTKVSRRHAAIRIAGGQVEIEDLGSSNGTFLNGKRVTRSSVPNGAKIAVGEFVLQVVNGQGGKSAPAAAGGKSGGAPAAKGGAPAKSGGAVMVVAKSGPVPQQRGPQGKQQQGRARQSSTTGVAVPSESAQRAADQALKKIGGFAWRTQIFMIVGAVGLALFLDIIFIVSRSQSDYAELALSRARLITQQLAAQNASYLASKEDLLIKGDAAKEEIGVKDVYLIAADGTIRFPTTLRDRNLALPIVKTALQKRDFSVEVSQNAENGEWVDIAAPVQVWDRENAKFDLVGVAYIVFAPDEVAKRATSAVTLYAVAALILGIAGGAGALLLIRSTEPAIGRLQEDTELIIRGDLKKVQSSLKLKELEALAHSISRLAERVGQGGPQRSAADAMASGFSQGAQLALPAQAGPVDNAGASATVKALVAAIPDAAIVVDADSNVVEVNKAAERLLGLIPSRVRGKHLLEAITDRDVLNSILDLLNEISAAPDGVVSRPLTIAGVEATVTAAGVRQGKELAGSAIVISAPRADAEGAA